MIASIAFTGLAAVLVWYAGRRDCARDPLLTGVALGLAAVFPLLAALLPKWWFPSVGGGMNSATAAMEWLPVVWGIGAVLLLLRLALGMEELRRWRRMSILVDRSGRVEIRILEGIRSPVAAGVVRPIVYVPLVWRSWSEGTRRMVMDHELCHHARRDPLWRMVAEAAIAANWFNPLVWWIARRMVFQCELACDERVIGGGVARARYADLLCDLADADSSVPALVVPMAGRSSLEARVRHLMGGQRSRPQGGVLGLVCLALVAAAACALMGPAAEPFDEDEIRMRWQANPFPGE